jgi:SAM-dependent methyltransferase
MVESLRNTEKAGIIGALYYTRGGGCRPVLMKEGTDGGFYWMRDDEITHGVQEVAVTGGGCFLFDMNIFSVIPYPWFEPELSIGTDLQICKKAREHGFKVLCDTSIEIGHVMARHEIVTSKNRHRIFAESNANEKPPEGMDPLWSRSSALYLYAEDAQEYLSMDMAEMADLADTYRRHWQRFPQFEDKKEYYRTIGKEQLARQVYFHLCDEMVNQYGLFISSIDTSKNGRGLDFGCGSAPLGFELALRGHNMDFVDVDGAAAYEFTKWRAKYRGIDHRCGWSMNGHPYDYALFMDSIEHLPNWDEVLTEVVGKLKPNGCILTNYFFNADYDNAEHISMDKEAVKNHLISLGVYPLNEAIWIKRDLTIGGKVT